jgi:hypothetical protein
MIFVVEKREEETEIFETIKKDLIRIAGTIGAIRSIKIQDLDKLEKYVQTIPNGDEIKSTLDSCSANLQGYINIAKKNRLSSFQPLINSFLESLSREQKDLKIIENNLFRVGCLEVETKPETGRIRVSFNENILIPWRPITNSAEIESALSDARKKLLDTRIEPERFPDFLFNAYKKVRILRERQGERNSDLVPIRSLHSEVILELFQYDLQSRKNFDAKFSEIYYPFWAFQYNLDKYRSSADKVPPEKRLFFEQGDQTDTGKMGVVLNGLTANSLYKDFCYLRYGGIK